MRFSENLKVLRKNNGMTQKELSQALGVALSTVAMWETGNRKPDLETFRAMILRNWRKRFVVCSMEQSTTS